MFRHTQISIVIMVHWWNPYFRGLNHNVSPFLMLESNMFSHVSLQQLLELYHDILWYPLKPSNSVPEPPAIRPAHVATLLCLLDQLDPSSSRHRRRPRTRRKMLGQPLPGNSSWRRDWLSKTWENRWKTMWKRWKGNWWPGFISWVTEVVNDAWSIGYRILCVCVYNLRLYRVVSLCAHLSW